MIRQDEFDEQKWRLWRARVARERTNLSASVEETLSEDSALEDPWEDEADGSGPQGAPIIPPRLSLQSKVLSAVPLEDASPEAMEKPVPEARRSGNVLTQLAQRVTTSLAALGSAWQPLPPNVYAAAAFTQAEAAPPVVREKQRLAGHTTRVHLEAAPKFLATQRVAETDDVPREKTTNASLSSMREGAERDEAAHARSMAVSTMEATNPKLTVVGVNTNSSEKTTNPHLATAAAETRQDTPPDRMLSGSGIFERGQGEAAVALASITEACVIVVMLTGDPGPVVVQYVTLRPQIGFTIHLSAPTTRQTSFNYIVLIP